MITWITVWVLTVSVESEVYGVKTHYQLTYGSQKVCLSQAKNHSTKSKYKARCDFQQIPVVSK